MEETTMSSSAPSRSTVFATNLVTLLLVLSAAFGLYLLASGVVGAIRGGHEVVAHQEIAVGAIDSLPENAVGPERLRVPLRIKDAGPEQNLYAVGRDIVPGFLVFSVLWLLRRILVSVREGDPFTAFNVRRLRLIGLLLLIGTPIAALTASAFEQALASSVSALGSGIAISVPGGGLIAGLGVFVLAQVFEHGVRLREDVAGTV
jgi:hypothetical protein